MNTGTKEGSTVIVIPQQTKRICNGCKYLISDEMVRGRKIATNNYTCEHPALAHEVGIFTMRPGRQIHYNQEGTCETPTWCPYLDI